MIIFCRYYKNNPKRQNGISSILTLDQTKNLQTGRFEPSESKSRIKKNIFFSNFVISISSEGIRGHFGSKSNDFKPAQIIYQNEAHGPVVKKKWSVIRGHTIPNWGYLGSFQFKIIFKPGQIGYHNEALGPVVT